MIRPLSTTCKDKLSLVYIHTYQSQSEILEIQRVVEVSEGRVSVACLGEIFAHDKTVIKTHPSYMNINLIILLIYNYKLR